METDRKSNNRTAPDDSLNNYKSEHDFSMAIRELNTTLTPLIQEAINATGMVPSRIIIDAVEAYCKRKIKLVSRICPDRKLDKKAGNRVVENVIQIYNRICCPPLPKEDEKSISATIRKNILSKPADYDWESHFSVIMQDKWAIKQAWCTLRWIVGPSGFFKVQERAKKTNATAKVDEYGTGFDGAF